MNDPRSPGWAAQIERLRTATPDEKLRAAAEQRRISLDLMRAGLRASFPDLDEQAIEHRMGELAFGPDVWREICERRERCRRRTAKT